MRFIVSAVCLAALTACASQSPETSSASPTGESSEQLSASSGTSPALDVLKQGGPFAFALDESDPAKVFHDQCTTQSAGDSTKADACYARIREEGAHELIRFALASDGHLVWTSYGIEDGKEVLFLEIPLAVTTDGDHAVVGRAAGTARGRQAGDGVVSPSKRIRFEVPNATTVVMVDPQKGRLVYHRAS
jgi:hypothetical protein